MKIGILALQGDFAKHAAAIEQLGHEPLLVRYESELNQCHKLIIPGGESTTILKLIEKNDLRPALIEFGRQKAIMGTCAGLIVLSNDRGDLPHDPLGLIDLQVERNAYGRQIDSFVDTVKIHLNGEESEFEGVFIRAPKIRSLGQGVKPLGYHKKDVVMAANPRILVATFHPELTDDLRIHRYFIEQIGK